MSPHTMLALGFSTFFGSFACLFLCCRVIYICVISTTRRGRPLMLLTGTVFLLALPYFFDRLVGFKNEFLSADLETVIGLCAVLVLVDVTRFIYNTYGPPSHRTGHGMSK